MPLNQTRRKAQREWNGICARSQNAAAPGGGKKVLGVQISEHTGKAPGVPRKYTECTGEAVSCDYEL